MFGLQLDATQLERIVERVMQSHSIADLANLASLRFALAVCTFSYMGFFVVILIGVNLKQRLTPQLINALPESFVDRLFEVSLVFLYFVKLINAKKKQVIM